MRKCLIVLCSHKDLGIARIQTPYTSKGVELEMQIAEVLGYEIKTVDEWVRRQENKTRRNGGIKNDKETTY